MQFASQIAVISGKCTTIFREPITIQAVALPVVFFKIPMDVISASGNLKVM
jgi:hypothetical protein